MTSSDAELRFIKTSLTRVAREAPSLGPMSDSALLLGQGNWFGNRNPVNALYSTFWLTGAGAIAHNHLIASRIQPITYSGWAAAMPFR